MNVQNDRIAGPLERRHGKGQQVPTDRLDAIMHDKGDEVRPTDNKPMPRAAVCYVVDPHRFRVSGLIKSFSGGHFILSR